MALLWALGLAVGCSKGDTVGSSSGAPPWMLPGDDETGAGTSPVEPDSGRPPPADSDTGRPPTTGPEVTTGDEITSGPPPMGSTSGPPGDSGNMTFGGSSGGDDNGMQPVSGWWEHCIPGGAQCDAGFTCIGTDDGTDGICTQFCSPAGNPGSCGPSPGGTNMPICLSVNGNSYCALGCEGGLTCPGGMICHTENDDLGPVSICI